MKPGLTRRQFSAAALALSRRRGRAEGADGPAEALRRGVAAREIPAAAAIVAGPEKIIYQGAFGHRDSAGPDLAIDSIFSIASMTKAITTVAALQLVERGRLKLDEPVADHLPRLGDLSVLEGFDSSGKPILRPARPVLLKHLLTHTSGFAYSIWDSNLKRYQATTPKTDVPPLMFQPGTRWEYGTSIDWTGRLVEAVSGRMLEEYFQQEILQPLGMKDTSYILPQEKFDRLVSGWQRQSDGMLKEEARKLPKPPTSFNGGGGLYSTVADYTRFMQMILRRGRTGDGRAILRAGTVGMMQSNQIGELRAGILHSVDPAVSSDVDFHPGHEDGFTYGFLINRDAHQGGRAAGSLAWAGIENTYFWIDPRRNRCAVLMMQFLPFCDKQAIGLLQDFERAVYARQRSETH